MNKRRLVKSHERWKKKKYILKCAHDLTKKESKKVLFLFLTASQDLFIVIVFLLRTDLLKKKDCFNDFGF